MLKKQTTSSGGLRRPKNSQTPHQMAFYVFQYKYNFHVDTNLLCVEILISIPNPINIDMIAVPP